MECVWFPGECGRGEGIGVFLNMVKPCRFVSVFNGDFLESQTGVLVPGEFCDLFFWLDLSRFPLLLLFLFSSKTLWLVVKKVAGRGKGGKFAVLHFRLFGCL